MQRSVRAAFRSIVHAVWIGLTGGLLTASGATADTLWIDRLGDTIPRGIAVEYDGATTLAMARASGSLAAPVYELYQFAHSGELRWRVDLKVDSRFDVTAVSHFGVEQTIKTNDEFLAFWRLAMQDGDPLHRNLVSLPQTDAGGIILGDSLLGLWRVGADGRAYWHRPLAPSFGLSLMTEMASFADGLILVGGLSTATDGGCASAAVTQIDEYGFTKWRWRFDHHRGTYPIRLVPWPSGMTLALVTTGHGNRYVASWGDTTCGGRKVDGEWLVWLNPDGTTARIIEMSREMSVLCIAGFADGRTVVAAWGPRELLFRIYGPGGEVLAERAFDRWRVFGWSEHAYAVGRFEMDAVPDRISLIGYIACNQQVYWPCPGQGMQLVQLTPDLRLREMPTILNAGWWLAHGTWNSTLLVLPVLRATFDLRRD